MVDEPVSPLKPQSLESSTLTSPEPLMIVELFRLEAFNSPHAGRACTLFVSPPSLVRCP